jgi:pimeloyl-ACP methyl ester carboxylesterase
VTAPAFREGWVEAGGARVHYREAGQGTSLVHLAGADYLTAAHDLLARRHRVVVIDPADTALSPATLLLALQRLGIATFDLVGSAGGAAAALRLALHVPERVRALVLESPEGSGDDDLERRLPDLTTPALVLAGTGDPTGPSALGRACKDRMPNGHLVYVYAAGATIAAERPEAFVEVVADFLERHEAFVISRARTVIHP